MVSGVVSSPASSRVCAPAGEWKRWRAKAGDTWEGEGVRFIELAGRRRRWGEERSGEERRGEERREQRAEERRGEERREEERGEKGEC